MENPNQRGTAPSITSILKKISDDKALVLFNSIAVSTDNERLIPLREMNLSTKQYYSRISGLVDAGLIKGIRESISSPYWERSSIIRI
ncbi:MAG TPA: hypothetical protein VGW09_05550 [Nitrososphaeraceae archaeon]|nr:hypothetical protein [Nitrososphaeraceae archaeon]